MCLSRGTLSPDAWRWGRPRLGLVPSLDCFFFTNRPLQAADWRKREDSPRSQSLRSWARAGKTRGSPKATTCFPPIQGGGRGIRTLGTLRYTRFPSVHVRPLRHPSALYPGLRSQPNRLRSRADREQVSSFSRPAQAYNAWCAGRNPDESLMTRRGGHSVTPPPRFGMVRLAAYMQRFVPNHLRFLDKSGTSVCVFPIGPRVFEWRTDRNPPKLRACRGASAGGQAVISPSLVLYRSTDRYAKSKLLPVRYSVLAGAGGTGSGVGTGTGAGSTTIPSFSTTLSYAAISRSIP